MTAVQAKTLLMSPIQNKHPRKNDFVVYSDALSWYNVSSRVEKETAGSLLSPTKSKDQHGDRTMQKPEQTKTPIAKQIADIQELTAEIRETEQAYQARKKQVSDLWKEYFPAAESKKALQARRKVLKAQLEKKLESCPELRALLATIN